ncbi:GPI mannosyltransferase 3-like isoform X2 [Corticium candelabrum]|uniref:GPI mannosyltransferase 3-like isoform X2 n=1 Tax=Corticium candelabrum TaxID=121492 RepID=UPI002E25C192|nr:GPI mannosyltransferase 3-like isoform X2 [Corticium candelabrum]
MPMLCSLTSWFSFYCMPRTLANSLEAALITVTLSIWFTSSSLRSSKCVWVCFSIGALSVLIRPTSAVVWLVVFGTHLVAATNKLDFILLHVLPVAVIAAFVSVALDSYFYGKFVVALWNFFKFNVLYDLGSLFGTHPWHWYLSQGIPVVFGTHLPLCLLGVVNVPSRRLLLFVVMCCYVVIHSLLSHKEFRFMVPLLPLAAVYAGHFCSTISGKWRTTVLVSLIVFNTPVAVYTSLIHQRGTLSVMRYLDGEAQEGRVESVLFLMPCHSTPLYSHFHHNISLRHLDCSPSLDVDYVGEDDRFYGDPVNWLNESYSHEKELPSHIVIYDLLEKELELLFGYKKYSKVEVFFHTHFHEKRIGQTVIVYRRWSH